MSSGWTLPPTTIPTSFAEISLHKEKGFSQGEKHVQFRFVNLMVRFGPNGDHRAGEDSQSIGKGNMDWWLLTWHQGLPAQCKWCTSGKLCVCVCVCNEST
jgi:hypothetical protein